MLSFHRRHAEAKLESSDSLQLSPELSFTGAAEDEEVGSSM